jgi:hypothetical protein
VPIQRVVSSDPLATSQVKSLAPAHADIPRSMAGRVRYLYELATGAVAFADGGATPLNPQGRLGIDHSGPPWGVAFQHPLWCLEGLPPISGATEVYGEAPALTLSTQNQTLRLLARFYVRPFQRGPTSPYARGYLTMSCVAATAGTATADVTIYDANRADPSAARRSSTLTCASTSVPTNIASEVYAQLEPGYCERVIEVKITSTVAMTIHYASINQIARRSH